MDISTQAEREKNSPLTKINHVRNQFVWKTKKSPKKCIDIKDKHIPSSFVRRWSSKIYKLFPKSPSKDVDVLKRIWEWFCKSPRRRGYMQKYSDESDWEEIGKLLYKIGKQKGKKIKKKQTMQKLNWKTNTKICINHVGKLIVPGLSSEDFYKLRKG